RPGVDLGARVERAALVLEAEGLVEVDGDRVAAAGRQRVGGQAEVSRQRGLDVADVGSKARARAGRQEARSQRDDEAAGLHAVGLIGGTARAAPEKLHCRTRRAPARSGAPWP